MVEKNTTSKKKAGKTKDKTEKKLMGRPPKFSTPEDMQVLIDKYFNEKVGYFPMKDQEGQIVMDKDGMPHMLLYAPTVSGLALYLGFCDRKSMYEYGAKQNFTHTISTATSRIADFAETQLHQGKPTGAIFWLKNHGWHDKTESTNINFNSDIVIDLGIDED